MKYFENTGPVPAVICVLVLLAGAAVLAYATGTAGPGGNDSRELHTETRSLNPGAHAPPPEAVSACAGKSAGNACRFADRDGISAGTCDDTPGILACAPARDRVFGNATGEDVQTAGGEQQGSRPGTTRSSVTPTGVPAAGSGAGPFLLTSDAGTDGTTLPAVYTCDGSGATPAMSWSGAPAGTEEFALMMTTLPGDGTTRWNWVLYGIPGTATGLAKNSPGTGTTGTGSHGTIMQYDPPCSQGPGAKLYTFTLYALSGPPALPVSPEDVTGPVLTEAIANLTLANASFSLSYTRPAGYALSAGGNRTR